MIDQASAADFHAGVKRPTDCGAATEVGGSDDDCAADPHTGVKGPTDCGAATEVGASDDATDDEADADEHDSELRDAAVRIIASLTDNDGDDAAGQAFLEAGRAMAGRGE